MIRTRAVVVLLLAALAVAACGRGGSVVGPAPVSGQRCEGMPAVVCARIAAGAQRQAPPGAGAVVGIRIVCTTTCTEAAGEATVTVTYANGQTSQQSQGWASPVGPPPGAPGGPAPIVVPTPPVTPTCVGLPKAKCDEQVEGAMTSLNGADPASIVTILIRCTGTCTEANGDGDTVVTLQDGRRLESSWAYRSPG